MIRSLLIYSAIVFAAILGFTFLEFGSDDTESTCDSVLTYRLGNIDSRFHITENQIREVMKEVERLWSGALDKELLSQRDDGKIAIHFEYGDQQKFFEDEQTTSIRIEGKEHQYNTQEKEYRSLSQKYKKSFEQYNAMLAEYNNLVTTHNKMIRELRGKKITPEDERSIKQREEKINSIKIRLDQKQQEVESLRQRTNVQAEQLNEVNSQRNELISEYNSEFAVPKKFDQGRYVREGSNERIYVYQFSNMQSLKAVLAHEVGHALGIAHVNNPESVMYELMSEQNVVDLQLSKEDIEALRQQCPE